jgi:nicotinamide-nucleotide amidase
MTGGARVVGVDDGLLGHGVEAEMAAVVRALEEHGVAVASRTLVEAEEAACEGALAPEAPLTVVVASEAGAAGDLLRRVIARAHGARLVLNERMLAVLQDRYRRVDRPVPRALERLALLPQGAVVWESGDGEPGWALESERGVLAALPRGGDLAEWIGRHVVPFARAHVPHLETVLVRTLKVSGVSAAELEDRLGDRLGGTWTGTRGGEATSRLLAAEGEIGVRLRARGASAEAAADALARAEASLAEALGADCYGRDDERLEHVVGRLLRERDLTLAVAESCTGGLVGDRLTNIAGSSAYFERGVVVYSNRAKQELLGVPEAVLIAHGAVSAPCAEAMVQGICERAGTACGLAITGIAGPDGGTPAKPVGTVFIGVAVPGHLEARHFVFLGDRRAVKWQSSQAALDLLRRRLLALGPHR